MSDLQKFKDILLKKEFTSNAEKRRLERALKELEKLKKSNADRTK